MDFIEQIWGYNNNFNYHIKFNKNLQFYEFIRSRDTNDYFLTKSAIIHRYLSPCI